MLLERTGAKPSDFKYAVFHQPNGKFPLRAAKLLGFTEEQVKTGLLTPKIGNTYSGAVPLGLSAVLDEAKSGDRIFVVSYGSGAGSDGFDITVTDAIEQFDRAAAPTVKEILSNVKMLDYGTYAKFRGKIVLGGE
jgi:hydroxymethylglutaryl-CoA synthase